MALSASNSTEKIKGLPGRHPLVCKLEASSVNMMDLDSCFVGVSGTSNTLIFTPTPKGKETVPYLNLSSSNQSLTIRESVNRYSAAGVALNVAAHPVVADNKARRKHLLDSLHKVYPGVPRDSLFFKAFSQPWMYPALFRKLYSDSKPQWLTRNAAPSSAQSSSLLYS